MQSLDPWAISHQSPTSLRTTSFTSPKFLSKRFANSYSFAPCKFDYCRCLWMFKSSGRRSWRRREMTVPVCELKQYRTKTYKINNVALSEIFVGFGDWYFWKKLLISIDFFLVGELFNFRAVTMGGAADGNRKKANSVLHMSTLHPWSSSDFFLQKGDQSLLVATASAVWRRFQ